METEKANGQYGKQNPLFMYQGTAGYSIRAEPHGSKGGVEAAFDEKELSHAIDAFLRTLPERECSIFLRRYWFVDSVRDISERFGINENSVKSILFRTRERLRKHLEREGFAL